MNEVMGQNSFIITKPHFHLLKISSLPSETKIFIERYPSDGKSISKDQIIRDRWFGNKSDARIKNIVQVFHSRFLIFQNAFSFLKSNFTLFGNADWKWIILIHLIVTDPNIRWFACKFLPTISEGYEFSKDQVARAIEPLMGENIRANTRITYSSKLIGAFKSIGLVSGKSKFARVRLEYSPLGFYYVLYLLQSIQFDLNSLPSTDIYLGFFKDKEELRSGLDRLAAKGYISVSWYGDSPSIQLKQIQGVMYL